MYVTYSDLMLANISSSVWIEHPSQKFPGTPPKLV